MNTICLSGRLCETPELKTTSNGISVCSFRLAVQRPGNKEVSDFFICVAWRQKAEFLAKYFEKGQKVEVCGMLTSRKYEDSKGSSRTITEIVCNEIYFGESKRDSQKNNTDTAQFSNTQDNDFEELPTDDDLPF